MPTITTKPTRRRRTAKTYRLYALLLTDSKYYIGLTTYKDVRKRFREHLAGTTARGAKWTSLHKPRSIIEIRELGKVTRKAAETRETLMTLEYIKKFGLAHVRGGALCATAGAAHLYWYDRVKKRKAFKQAGTTVIVKRSNAV